MAEKTLQDYANEAKRTADAERGKREFYQPPAGRQANLRILEWPGHVPCWIQTYVHYLETSEGKKVLTCGDENCYTCGRLHELAHSQNKADMEFVRQSARKMKVIMYVVDWDNQSAGPQLWEPKNTQNCNTWSTLLQLFTDPDWGERVYRFNQGCLIGLVIVKETRKMRSGQMEMAIQKSLVPNPNPRPIPYKRDGQGNNLIQLQLPNGNKQVFKLPDLGESITPYDEDYHRQCWGDEPAPAGGDFGGDVTFDENAPVGGDGGFDEGAGFSEPVAGAGGDDLFAAGGGDDAGWGEAPAVNPTPAAAPAAAPARPAAPKAPAAPTRPAQTARRPTRPQPATRRPAPARGKPAARKR